MCAKTSLRMLKITAITVAAVNLLAGIAGLFTQQHMYFLAMCFWVFSGVAVMICHGVPLYGGKNMVIFFLLGCGISLFFEAMGCDFGIFFSKYYYTDYIPGPKIFGFNVMSMVGYGSGVYMMFAIGHAAVGKFGSKFEKYDVITVPLISALMTVAIDFMTDPFLATLTQAYHWEQPGVFYGIPYQNYLGWYMLAYTLYQVMALVVYVQDKRSMLPPRPDAANYKGFWIWPTVMFASLFLQLPFYALIPTDTVVTNYAGQLISSHQTYWGVMIVESGALLLPCLIIIFCCLRNGDLTSDRLCHV